MRKDVENFMAQCLVCQQIKGTKQAPVGLLQPLPIPQSVWSDISMDFVVSLSSSHGYTDIFVVVDQLTKYAYFGALRPNYRE